MHHPVGRPASGKGSNSGTIQILHLLSYVKINKNIYV